MNKSSQSKIISIIAFLLLVVGIFAVSYTVRAETIEEQAISIERLDYRTNEYDLGNGKFAQTSYLGFINYHNGSGYVPINKSIVNSLDPLFDYEVTRGIYQAYFKENPTEGQVVKFVIGSEYITYQPMALNYRNDLSQLQQVSMIQNVIGVSNNNSFLYENAYGENIDLKYSYWNDFLREELIINSSTDLISPEQYIIDGGNPTLDLDFILTTNSNKILIDDIEWDKKNTKETSNEVYIKDEEGNILYYLKKPYAYDSNGSSQLLTYQFKKQGNSLYVIIKTPYSWISNSSRVYPIFIDPDTGATNPGTMADDSAVGTEAWGNPDNAKTQDNAYAEIVSATAQSHYLKATNFGFSIPAGSTVDGITVEIERFATGGGLVSVNDNAVKLVNGAGTVVGDNKAVGPNWATSDTNTYQTYGGSSDNWNAGLDDTDINDIDFGVVITVDLVNAGPPAVADIDHMRITVYYTEGAGDTTPPTFTTIPANTTITYTQGFGVDFDATDETAFDTFAINWTTLFEINSTGYLKNSTANIGVGIYLINVTINDTSNNVNSTLYKVTINKATPIGSLTNSDTWTEPYLEEVIIGLSESNTGDADVTYKIYRDGVDKGTGETVTLGVGTYDYVLNTTGGANWTTVTNMNSETLTVTKITPVGSLAGTTPIIYGTQGDVTGSESNTGDGGCSYKLYRESVEVSNPDTTTLGVGVYNYVYNTTGCANYTSVASLDTFALTINKATLSGSQASSHAGGFTYTYDNVATTISLSESNTGDADVTYKIYRDAVDKGTGETVNLAVGNYAYILNSTGGANWSTIASMDSDTLTINIATPTGSIAGTTSITYGTAGDLQGTESNSVDGGCTYLLYKDGGQVSNPDTEILGVGNYDYVYNTTGCTNFTSSASLDTETLIVNKATLSGSLTNTDTWTEPYLEEVTIGLSESNTGDGDVTYIVYRDGVSKGTGETVTLGVNTYAYILNSTGGANYSSSASLDAETLTINKIALTGGLAGTSPINYLVAGDVVGTESNTGDGDVSYKLYRESVEVSNPDTDVLGVGVWNYVYNSTGGANYSSTASIDTFALTVNKIALSASVTNNRADTFTYDGTPANIGISESNTGDGDVTYILWKDDVNVGSSDSQAGAGTFNYKINSTGGANYSSSASLDTLTLTINKATPTGTATGTSPINYLVAGNVEGTETNTGDGDVTYKLYREGVEVSNPDASTLGVGVYNYIYNSTSGTNYSAVASLDTFALTVNQISSSINLTLGGVQGNFSINEDNSIDLNCSTISGDSGAYLVLYNNGTLINNDTSPIGNTTLFADTGDYNITCVYEETTNYTTSSETWWLEVNDTTAPTISNFKVIAINSSGDQIGTDQTAFNFTNLEEIEYMNISFEITDVTGINGDIKIYFTANGTSACSLGNNQSTTCYNFDSSSWIEFQNGTDTSTFRDIGGSAQGDSITCSYTSITNGRNYTCQIDEHYNPNVWKHYPLNFSDIKWQSGNTERIKKNTIWKIEVDFANIPLDADYYKLDFRVNATVGLTPTQPIITYACNSTYTTGDPALSDMCQLIASKSPSELIDDGTKYRAFFTNNITTGILDNLGDVKYFLITTDSPTSKYYTMKSYGFLGSDAIRTSISNDKGDSYSVLADGYETELNINWFYDSVDSNSTQILFKIYSNDDLGNNANSSIQLMTWGAGDLNIPPIVNIIVPELNSNQTGTLQINWTTAELNGDSYTTNITMNNGTEVVVNSTLSSSISSVSFDTTILADGLWNLTVESCENSTSDLFCGNDTHQILVDNTLPVISIISPTDGYSVYDYVSGSVPIFTNFSLTETNPDSCWQTIDGGVTNTSVPCLSGYNNFTFSLSSVGTFTLEISANDSLGQENSSSIQIIVSAYTGPQTGGGTTTDPSENIIVDFNLYNNTIMCEEVNKFLELRTSNYTSDQRESLKNNLALVFGFGIIDSVLDKYLENFEYNCPEYFDTPDEPEDVVDDGDAEDNFWNSKAFLFIIIGAIVIFIILIILLDINYLSLKKLYHKKS